MKPRPVLVLALMMSALAACNLPSSNSADQVLAATITAQSAAIETRSAAAADDMATPAAGNGATGALVSVSADSHCRTGPGPDFDLVLTMHPGSKSPVVGKYTPANYWIINNPAGGTCWLSGLNAQVEGDTSSLPEFAAPAVPAPNATKALPKPTKAPKPTATPILLEGQILVVTAKVPKLTPVQIAVAPNAPGNLKWENRTCDSFIANDGVTPRWSEAVTLTWQDSIDETGYHVYKNNQTLPDIAAGSTAYHISMTYNQGTGGPLWTTWTVEAFNAAGVSPKSVIDVPNCP